MPENAPLAITMPERGSEAEHIEALVALKRQTEADSSPVLRGLNLQEQQQNVREKVPRRVD